MKELIRKDLTCRMDELPELESNCFTYNEITGYTGSIVKRPLKRNGIYWHYAFIYGFDRNSTLWLIENNDNGVECVTWRDFLSDKPRFEFVHYESTPDRFEEILSRACERADHNYDVRPNNCEHFVNYCVHGKLESFQSEITEKIADALLSFLEVRISISPSSRDHQLLVQLNEFRQTIKLKRHPKLDEIVSKRIKGLSQNQDSESKSA